MLPQSPGHALAGAGPLWAVLWRRHRVQSTVLYDHGRGHK